MTVVWEDDSTKLAEQQEEEKSAKFFGITVEKLRQQRRECGQLLTGPYAGCSPGFARTMESIKELSALFKSLKEDET